ncbi:MAG: dUTP diphosphatase [Tissierellia bacterium]|nr:dUTP diphosphatase [Tissierellia bacterium]
MKIYIRNKSTNPLPEYATIGSSGMDLRANLDGKIRLNPLERQLIPTGIYLEIPRGYEVQIRARSGLSIKHGITLVNGIGTIDSDYRGEIKVPIINLSSDSYEITDGERICQMVLIKVEDIELEEKEEFNKTKRGAGGFGHTGKK